MPNNAEFLIVEFLLDNSVECVPSSWVVGRTQCWWPRTSYSQLRLTTSVPSLNSNEWELLKIKILGKANNVFRVCKCSRRVESPSTVDNSEAPYVKKRRQNCPRKSLYSSEEDFSEIIEHDGRSHAMSRTAFSALSSIPASIPSSPSSTSVVVDTPVVHLKTSSCHCHHFEKWSNVIISKLTSIEQTLQSLLAANASVSMPQLQEVGIEIELLTHLPHRDVHSLIKWSEKLKHNNRNRDLVVNYFILVGGYNYKSHIMHIMSKLMVDEVASKFSLFGRTRDGATKLSFTMLALDSVIRDAICKKFPKLPIPDIERTMAEYFKLAAERTVSEVSIKKEPNVDHSDERTT